MSMTSVAFNSMELSKLYQTIQLWTVYLSFGQNSISVIHCLLISKDEELYHAVLHKIQEVISQLQPVRLMSDWYKAAPNAFRQVYQGVSTHVCWFHYT